MVRGWNLPLAAAEGTWGGGRVLLKLKDCKSLSFVILAWGGLLLSSFSSLNNANAKGNCLYFFKKREKLLVNSVNLYKSMCFTFNKKAM